MRAACARSGRIVCRRPNQGMPRSPAPMLKSQDDGITHWSLCIAILAMHQYKMLPPSGGNKFALAYDIFLHS